MNDGVIWIVFSLVYVSLKEFGVVMSNLDTIFKVPLSGGGLILLLLFS